MDPVESWWNLFMVDFAAVSTATMIIPVLTAIYYRKHWNRALTVAFLYCIAALGLNLFEQGLIWAIDNYTDFFIPYLEYWKITNTFFLLILYHVVDFLLLGLFYSLIFPIPSFKTIIL